MGGKNGWLKHVETLYPLVKINKELWNITMLLMEQLTFSWPFLVAMLKYHRVERLLWAGRHVQHLLC